MHVRASSIGLGAVVSLLFTSLAKAAPEASSDALENGVVIPHNHPLIHFHGRWDVSPGTWWVGSGFKLHVQDLSSLALNLGSHTTSPLVSIGVSVDYAPFYTVNVTQGSNVIYLNGGSTVTSRGLNKSKTVVRINVEGWQNNRINLETIVLNKVWHADYSANLHDVSVQGAKLLPYQPSRLGFQFIGDSLSAGVGPGSQGQFLPQGVDQAWPFLVGERFNAEHNVNAQPGAALTDIVSYGNEHGISFQYFRTEDTGYFYTNDHNFTTPWDFLRDRPAPTHVVVHIGANDASQNVTADAFVRTFIMFLGHLRRLYPVQPFFVFTPWGWPNADGTFGYYYRGQYERIVNERHLVGDRNTFLVNTTGWVTWDDVFPDNQHPNVPGHQKIAHLFEQWLEEWGLGAEDGV